MSNKNAISVKPNGILKSKIVSCLLGDLYILPPEMHAFY